MQKVILMIKIIAIDLDGTLFDHKKNISLENKMAIQEAKQKGCKVVIATGRPILGVLPVLKELNLTSNEDYVITYNGAIVFNVGTKEIIFSSTINGKTVKELYQESLRLGLNFHAFRKNEELITPKHNPYTDIESKINHIPDQIYDIMQIKDTDEFLKAMLVDSEENLNNNIPFIDKKFQTQYSMVRSSKIFLEFLNKNTNKGFALQALANHLNIDIKDTMAIGDAGNDLPMIITSGIGVAMENAFEEVKQKADDITSSNEENGVAKAIYKFII